ncbi:MAG: glycosyl hydrolase family 28-related protein [Balneolaceae bacterium]
MINSEGDLQLLLNSNQSEGSTHIEIVDEVWKASGVTIPRDVTLKVSRGARLVVEEGDTLVFNGELIAGSYPVFEGEGVMVGRPSVTEVLPQWFGAVGDGEHDDAVAMQRAADLAAHSSGKTLYVPEGTYLFGSDIVIRSNLENHGLWVKELEIDTSRTRFDLFTYVEAHYPVSDPTITFASDHEEVLLDPTPFIGLSEGETVLSDFREVGRLDGEGAIDLEQGGTLRLYSSDFFSSRNNAKGDQFYERNDLSRIVSASGELYPELAFDYPELENIPTWQEGVVYEKGDYVALEGEIFKATWPSGSGTHYEHAHLGKGEVGSVRPDGSGMSTVHRYEYEDGTEDSIVVWRKVVMEAGFTPPDVPVTVDGLRVEVQLKNNDGTNYRLHSSTVNVRRSNMTFRGLQVSVRDREATVSNLVSLRNVVNISFYDGYVSGATYTGLGYNLLNFNVADIRYYNTVSVNARKGMDGRHGKNITIQGGLFGVIDDHYGRNYTVRDVTLTGQSVTIPGYTTPEADLQAWHFRPIRPLGITGANVHIENVTIQGGAGGIFSARGDIGDLYGRVTLRDIRVLGNEGDVRLFAHWVSPDFDFYSPVRVPDRVLIENVHLKNSGRLELMAGRGFAPGSYGPVTVRDSAPIGEVLTTSRLLSLEQCTLQESTFEWGEAPGNPSGVRGGEQTVGVEGRPLLRLVDCRVQGPIEGLSEENLLESHNLWWTGEGELTFPLEFRNQALFQ